MNKQTAQQSEPESVESLERWKASLEAEDANDQTHVDYEQWVQVCRRLRRLQES